MVPRYSRPEMTAIWSAENRYRIWFASVDFVAEAMGKDGKEGVITGISTYSPACFEVKIEGEPDTTRRIIKFEDARTA